MLAPALLALPPVWHVAVRELLSWRASRSDVDLTLGRITGGPFGETQLEEIQIRSRVAAPDGAGTDVSVARVRFAIAWRLPSVHPALPWLKEIVLEGVRVRVDLTPRGLDVGSAPPRPVASVREWLPANFGLQADDFEIRRGTYVLHAFRLVLSGRQDSTGNLTVADLRAGGRSFASTFTSLRGQTFWKDGSLTVTGLDLGNGVALASATVDLSQLDRRRLDWECSLNALGGEVRGQGSVDVSRDQMALEIAATLHHTALSPLAQMLGVRGPMDGQVEQASFTFRGDPENLSASQMWISARATGFRWGERRWEYLDAQAVVVDRRVQLHRFDLRQDGNRLSLAGEYPLPPDNATGLVWTGPGSWWREAGFSCEIDARLEDLHALSKLGGPVVPEVAGRMSINGHLSAAPGQAEIEGYLNVEGSRLTIRGAPLDYLRSTLIFRGGAMEIADLQATHDADYLTAHGRVGLSGQNPDRRGEARVEVRDAVAYAPALASWPDIEEKIATFRHLDAVIRYDNGQTLFEPLDGTQGP